MGSHSTQPTCVIWELHRVDGVHLKTQDLRSKKRQKHLDQEKNKTCVGDLISMWIFFFFFIELE